MKSKITWIALFFSVVFAGPALLANTSGAVETVTKIDPASLIGRWELESLAAIHPDGTASTEWMGSNPKGVIVYLADGTMSVQIMRDPRATLSVPSMEKTTPVEKVQAFDSYYAYFGRWEFDASKSIMSHYVVASLWPNEVGAVCERRVSIKDGHLVLETTPRLTNGAVCYNRLVWKRGS